jgi:hypothetical protein
MDDLIGGVGGGGMRPPAGLDKLVAWVCSDIRPGGSRPRPPPRSRPRVSCLRPARLLARSLRQLPAAVTNLDTSARREGCGERDTRCEGTRGAR